MSVIKNAYFNTGLNEAQRQNKRLRDKLALVEGDFEKTREMLEQMLLRAKVAAATIQASASSIMVPPIIGNSKLGRTYQNDLDARLGRQAEQKARMDGCPEALYYGSSHESNTSVSDSSSATSNELGATGQQAIAIREVSSSHAQRVEKEDEYLGIWPDGQQQHHISREYTLDAANWRHQREENVRLKRTIAETKAAGAKKEQHQRAPMQQKPQKSQEQARQEAERSEQADGQVKGPKPEARARDRYQSGDQWQKELV